MSIQIHGKEYITVAERVTEAHKDLEEIDITTEVLYQEPVVIKATVKTKKGLFTGISAANPSKAIEKQSPYEVAETSAIGRALGFAGYGIVDGIATADEMAKAEAPTSQPKTILTPTGSDIPKCPKCGGEVWDNTKNKLNPKAPDYKCKDKNCLDEKGYVTGFWKPKNENVPHDAEGNEIPERQIDEVCTADDEPPMPTDEEISIDEVGLPF